jgi:para-aminobenzoate synthetase component II
VILIIDNYDSFTYNLVQYIGTCGEKIAVKRNDQITTDEIDKMKPEKIVISPGPGYPDDAGISLAVVKRFHTSTPILGVCLGHQCIVAALKGTVGPAGELVHGKSSQIYHDGRGIYQNVPNPFPAARYHSLIAFRENLPDCLEISAQTDSGRIMGVRHKEYPVEGVQFHPESILTGEGMKIIINFLHNGGHNGQASS